MSIQIFANNELEGRQEITDLYWFEEEGVHDWGGQGHYRKYDLEIWIDGKKAYPIEQREYKKCIHCGEVHKVGEMCPYFGLGPPSELRRGP